jgi:hypothetical protein
MEEIDYDKLADKVADRLRNASNASMQAQAVLDETWLAPELRKLLLNDTTYIAHCLGNNYAFEQQFKTILKKVISTIY